MRRNGFTLVEVTVALLIGAVVVLFAERLFNAVVDGTVRLRQARDALDRDANARRWLAEAFGSIATGENAEPFTGRRHDVGFTAWQREERGWLVRIPIDLRAVEGRLVAKAGVREVVLADDVIGLDLDYLSDAQDVGSEAPPGQAPGAQARFTHQWVSPVSPPIAVRVRIARAREPNQMRQRVDTLLLVVGPRG